MTRKWNIVHIQSSGNYDVKNGSIYNTEVSKSNLWENAGTTIDDADDLDLVNVQSDRI